MDRGRTALETLARLDRSGRRRPGRVFDDRVRDREGVAELLRARKLLKRADIKRFLVQVRSQFGHRGPDEECDQREKTKRAVQLKNQRCHSIPGLSGHAYSIKGFNSPFYQQRCGALVPGYLHYTFELAALAHAAQGRAQWRHGLRARHFSLSGAIRPRNPRRSDLGWRGQRPRRCSNKGRQTHRIRP
jgi:hypothetical protein